MDFNVFSGILRMNDRFSKPRNTLTRQYIVDENIKNQLIQTYHIDQIAGNGTDTDKIKNLLFWVSSNIYHNGSMMSEYTGLFDAITLLKRSFQKDKEHGLNCVCLSFVLSSIYLSLNIKAFPMWMMPYNPYDSDNHVVVNVFDSDLNKWVMVDPSFSSYFEDENQVILNSLELRNKLSYMEKPKLNREFAYNHHQDEELVEYYYAYMAKNSFSFLFHQNINTKNMYESELIYILPLHFSAKKRELLNIKFREKEYGESEWLKNQRKRIKESKYILTNFEQLYR